MITNSRSVINGTTAVFLADMIEFLQPLKWIFLLAFLLILADLRFGVLASKKRGEVVRFSRAIKRSGNKIVDYICWLLLASAFGVVFGEPFGIVTIREIILLVIFGVELESCFSNFFYYKGLNYKVDIFKFFKSKTDIIEIEQNKTNTNENN